METIKKIAVLGPESTGKSTLVAYLAKYYQTVFVPEYARYFLEEKGPGYRYSYDDLEIIARGQLAWEKEAESKAVNYLFCDTEFLVLKIWSEYVFGKVSPLILELVQNHRYDYYLLTNNDVAWKADPLRESTGTAYRKRLFKIYVDELNRLGVPYGIVSQTGQARFDNAVQLIENSN